MKNMKNEYFKLKIKKLHKINIFSIIKLLGNYYIKMIELLIYECNIYYLLKNFSILIEVF